MKVQRATPKTTNEKPGILVMSELVNRMLLANRIGTQTYNGDRDIYAALGYPNKLYFEDYITRYFRHDIAKAIIDRPVKASWKGTISVIENTRSKTTKFEKAWEDIYRKLKLKGVFIRADKLAGLGNYSVILLGLNDTRTREGFMNKVKPGAKLLYVKPLAMTSAVIDKWETDSKNPRYGKPKFYKVKVTNQAASFLTAGNTSSAGVFEQELTVHYSRIVHIVDDVLEDEVNGIPRLQAVFNRLIDLEKLVGGDAEMFWRGARPGYTGSVKDDYEVTTEMLESIQAQIEEFEHNLKRVLVNEGIDYKSLEQQIADPSTHVDVQIQMISAVTEIPKRILVGSERGELSSAQDKQEYISFVTSRREETNEPKILRPFIDHLIEYQIIPSPKEDDYMVVWDKLFSLSDKEKVELGKNRAIALKEWSTNPAAQYMLPFEMFLQFLMGLDDTERAVISEYRKELMKTTGQKELSLEEIAKLGQAAKRQFERTTSKDTRTESGANRKKQPKQ